MKKDPDEKRGYHIFAGYDNGSLVISLLTPDYRRPSGRSINTALGCKAPTFFKTRGIFFMLKSACTAFSTNDNTYATAESMLGTWTEHGKFAQGVNSGNTFNSQVTEALPVQGKPNAFIFFGDHWGDPLNTTYDVLLPHYSHWTSLHGSSLA